VRTLRAGSRRSGGRFDRRRFGYSPFRCRAAHPLLLLHLFELQISGSRDDTQEIVSWIARQRQAAPRWLSIDPAIEVARRCPLATAKPAASSPLEMIRNPEVTREIVFCWKSLFARR